MPADNPYHILGLPERFDLDDAAIRRAFLERVTRAHPDVSCGDEAQADSAALTAARDSLTNPESRANTLLDLLGGPSKEADKSLPHGFLASIMETREEIEADLASADPHARTKWLDWGRAQRADFAGRVQEIFAALTQPPPAPALREIRTTLNAWRYIERLVEQLDPAYDPNVSDFRP